MEKTEKALAIVMPAVTPEEATLAMQKYQDIVAAVCDKDDYQLIEGKQFRKKSGWRKIATAFNLSTEVVDEKSEKLGKTFAWHFTVKATAPNGRSAVGVGSCDAFEKAKLVDGKYVKQRVTKWGHTATGKSFPAEFENVEATPNSIHNIRSTAETRAVNRAISNLVGAGEVSAEEIEATTGNGHSEPKAVQAAPAASPAVVQAGAQVTNGKCRYCGSVNQYHKKNCPGANTTISSPAEASQTVDQAAAETNYQPTDEDVPPDDIPF